MPPRIDATLLRKRLRAGGVGRMLDRLDPAAIAHALTDLPPAELKIAVDHLASDRNRLTQTLQQIPNALLPSFLDNLKDRPLGELLGRLEPDDAKELARRLGDERLPHVLALMDDNSRADIERLLRYSDESAGGRMIPRFAAVSQGVTVGDAIATVRAAGPDVPLFYLYVTDPHGKLIGVVSLSHLVKASDNTLIDDVMTTDLVSVAPDADQETVARTVSRWNLLAVPVVKEGRILGLVTIDDVIDVLEKEATEDMYNLAGLSKGDRVFSPPLRSLRKRLPWNVLNLGTALIAANVVGLFEGTISKLVALAIFMPVVAGIGGNMGAQTLNVIIRGITLGELEFSSTIRALLKEITVGVGVGLILGSTMAVIAYLWKGNPMLGAVVAMAMIANLFVATFVGTAIPLTLKRLGFDPALGSNIFVTMCTDTFGYFSLLGLATLFMHYLV